LKVQKRNTKHQRSSKKYQINERMSIPYCFKHNTLDPEITEAFTDYLSRKGSCQYPGCPCTAEGHFNFGNYINFTVKMVNGCLLFKPSGNKKHRKIADKIFTCMVRILYDFVDETKGNRGMGEVTKEGVMYYLK